MPWRAQATCCSVRAHLRGRTHGAALLPACCAGFNNKPATDAIPLFVPVVSPLMQGLSPLLSGYAASPLRGAAEALTQQLRGAAPPLLRELLPLLDQMEPLTLDVAAGRFVRCVAWHRGAFLMRKLCSQHRVHARAC